MLIAHENWRFFRSSISNVATGHADVDKTYDRIVTASHYVSVNLCGFICAFLSIIEISLNAIYKGPADSIYRFLRN